MFVLTKLSLQGDSVLPAGYSSRLPNVSLINYVTNKSKDFNSLDDIEEGYQVVMTGHGMYDYHRTSEISEVLERAENIVIFRTQTSVYELKEECYACETQRHSCKHDGQ